MSVSVVMAVYNGAWCIERALDSVMAQSLVPEQILVCDDGSTDGTPDLVEQRYRDPVTVVRLPHVNAAVTRRAGLDRATGDWIAFLDADDTWVPAKLERQFEFIARHPEVRMVMSDGSYISASGVIRESWLSDYFDPVREMVGDLAPLLIERCFTLLSSTLVERGAYLDVGGLDQELAYSYDYDLWLRVAARHPAAILPERLITYFSSPGALSRNIEARYRDDLEILRNAEGGALGDRPDLLDRAAERAAALEYDLGLLCLRSGRVAEGRERMRRALVRGPVRRRTLAALGALAPGWAMGGLMGSPWLRRAVQGSRQPAARLSVPSEFREAA